MAIKIRSTNPLKARADRTAAVAKALVRKLMDKGLLPPAPPVRTVRAGAARRLQGAALNASRGLRGKHFRQLGARDEQVGE